MASTSPRRSSRSWSVCTASSRTAWCRSQRTSLKCGWPDACWCATSRWCSIGISASRHSNDFPARFEGLEADESNWLARRRIFGHNLRLRRAPASDACAARPAQVVKLVDAGDSKSPAARRAGSIPALGTNEFERPLFPYFLEPRQRMLLAGFVVSGPPENLSGLKRRACEHRPSRHSRHLYCPTTRAPPCTAARRRLNTYPPHITT